MRLSDIPTNPDTRMLRQFAGLWLLFFGAIGGWQMYRGHQWGIWVVAVAAVGGVVGLIQPRLLKPIFVTWMILAFPIGWLVSHTMLLLLFLCVFTPIGVALRMTGHDPLRLKKPKGDSFWNPKTQQSDPKRYLRQF